MHTIWPQLVSPLYVPSTLKELCSVVENLSCLTPATYPLHSFKHHPKSIFLLFQLPESPPPKKKRGRPASCHPRL